MSDKTLATFRLDPELWEAFKLQARKNGQTASDALTDFVKGYVAGTDTRPSQPETSNLDNLDARIDERINPLRAELTELRAVLEEHLPGKSQVMSQARRK